MRHLHYCAPTSNNVIDMKVLLDLFDLLCMFMEFLFFLDFTCSLVVPFNKKVDWNNPNIELMKFKIWLRQGFLLRIQWNCDQSLPLFRIRNCENDISISADSAIGLNFFLKRMSQILFCNGGPVSKRLFKDTLKLLGFTDPLCTI